MYNIQKRRNCHRGIMLFGDYLSQMTDQGISFMQRCRAAIPFSMRPAWSALRHI